MMFSGVRPIIILASIPMARILLSSETATTDGSLRTMPLPGTKTKILVVPRSIPSFFAISSIMPRKDLHKQVHAVPKNKWTSLGLVLASHVMNVVNFTWLSFNCTMYWIYVLECGDDKSWYIGYTSNLKKRLSEHQSGHGSQTTKRKSDWKLIYCEGYLNIEDAKGREVFLKSGSGRKFIKRQLTNYLI